MGRIVERLKAISGEDRQTHQPEKNRTYYDGYLTARMIFFSNELLAFRG